MILYISEKKLDDKVYLYRSSQKVKFTEIEAPKFIIDPNKTIVSSNVSCSLSSAAFKIIKADEPDILNYLSYWKYDSFNRYLYYNISGKFYQSRRFRYYYYQIDDNNIINIINDSELYQTFVSKRLNETNFELKIAESNDYISIENKEKDFYFPLISGLNTFQKYRAKNNNTSYRDEDKDLIINDNESTIRFNYKLAINDVLKIVYLERTVYNAWEERQNLGNSMYYYFNKNNIKNGSSLVISPKLFAFNTLKKEEYIITILYSDEKQKNYDISNATCSNVEIDDNIKQKCQIK